MQELGLELEFCPFVVLLRKLYEYSIIFQYFLSFYDKIKLENPALAGCKFNKLTHDG